MKILKRKSQLQRLADTVTDPQVLKAALPRKDKALKAGLVAGGLTALTAGSAGISSRRRREEGAPRA